MCHIILRINEDLLRMDSGTPIPELSSCFIFILKHVLSSPSPKEPNNGRERGELHV